MIDTRDRVAEMKSLKARGYLPFRFHEFASRAVEFGLPVIMSYFRGDDEALLAAALTGFT